VSGGKLLEATKLKWFVDLYMTAIKEGAPWKSLARHSGSVTRDRMQSDFENLLKRQKPVEDGRRRGFHIACNVNGGLLLRRSGATCCAKSLDEALKIIRGTRLSVSYPSLH
jgi:hypothetical protein